MREISLIIGGRIITTDQWFDVINPANGNPIARCPLGTMEVLDQAVIEARRALPRWSGLPDAQRATKLKEVAALIEQHARELSIIVTCEQGKTQSGPGANAEVGGAIAWTRAATDLSLPDEVIKDDRSSYIVLRRKPVGVVASITPWNWPLMIATWHIMPALRVGCTVVIKPSPFTPLSTIRLVELMNTVLPPGALNVITGDAEIGSRISTHPGIDKVVFTGSIETGKTVMRLAAGTLKRLTLELGGNDAGILLPNSHIDPLLEKLFWGSFVNAGQTCAALKRLYVHENQYEELVSKLSDYVSKIPIGDGTDPKNLIGPLTTGAQLDKVAAYVEEARARGARIVTGGARLERAGYFYPLTIIADATDDMLIVKEEQFGPALPILKYRDVEEALSRANSLNVGLGGSVWGDDLVEASKLAERLECGSVWVNQHGALHPAAPFGGIKSSGVGFQFGANWLKEYTTAQVLHSPGRRV